MVNDCGRATVEWNGTKSKGGNTNSRVDVRESDFKKMGRRTHGVNCTQAETQQEEGRESGDETEKGQTEIYNSNNFFNISTKEWQFQDG